MIRVKATVRQGQMRRSIGLPRGAEGVISVPENVYEQMTGEAFPQDLKGLPHPSTPAGVPWLEEHLPGRLPRMWKRFGGEFEISQASAAPSAGTRIRVTSGHFEHCEGTLVDVDNSTDCCIVMLTIFGRSTKVEIRREDVAVLP